MAIELKFVMSAGPGEDHGDLIPPAPPWMRDGLCREYPEVDFVPPDSTAEANRRRVAAAVDVCRRCLVQSECLAYALEDPSLIGVWGGTTAVERRARPARFSL